MAATGTTSNSLQTEDDYSFISRAPGKSVLIIL